MGTGAITEYIDVAQVVLYVFWIFFLFLVLYLHRESKREGYPLETDSKRNVRVEGFPAMPPPKTYLLPHGGGTRVTPREEPDRDDISPQLSGIGMPIKPTDNPMLDSLGPGSYAIRPQIPDLTDEGDPKIIPMRIAPDWSLESRDPDIIGKPVYGVDGKIGGNVTDVWVDQSEPQIRYLEVDNGDNRVLLPITFAKVNHKDGSVNVKSVRGEHFKHVPTTASPDQVTLQEEDCICAFYGGGTLYASLSE